MRWQVAAGWMWADTNGRVQAAAASPRRPRRGAPRSYRDGGQLIRTAAIDEKTAALVRLAATIAVDAAPYSFQHAIALALAAGATSDEIVASLEAVTPVTGAARVVQCAPKVALALGYDVEAALERFDR